MRAWTRRDGARRDATRRTDPARRDPPRRTDASRRTGGDGARRDPPRRTGSDGARRDAPRRTDPARGLGALGPTGAIAIALALAPGSAAAAPPRPAAVAGFRLPPARAAAAPPRPAAVAGVRLTWDAPAGTCPDQAALAGRIGALLGDRALDLDARARVRAAGEDRLRLDLQLRWTGGSLVRDLVADDCESLADATVVLVAVLAAPLAASRRLVGPAPPVLPPLAGLDPGAPSPLPTASTSPGGAPSPLPSASTSSGGAPSPLPSAPGDAPSPLPSAPSPAKPAPGDADPSGGAPAPRSPAASAATPPDLDPAPADRAPAPLADDLDTLAAPRPARTPRLRRRGLVARVSGIAGYGAMPRGDFGLALAIGWLFPRVRLEGGALVLPGQAAALGDGSGRGATVRLVAASVRACPRFLGGAIELGLCGAVEAGGNWATSVGLIPERRAGGPWLAFALGGALDGWFSPQVGLHLAVDAIGAPVNTSYTIGGEPLAIVRPFGVRGSFGLTIALAPQKASSAEKRGR